MRALADGIPDVIARVDRELRLAYVNRAARASFDDPAHPIVGCACAEIQDRAAWVAPLCEAARRAFASGSEQAFQFEAGLPGEPRHYMGRVVPEVAGDGSIAGAIGIAYDVTAHAQEARERGEQLALERTARQSAETATLARDQFLAIVSHELRSPLNGIKSWTHVLENQVHDPDPVVRRAIAGIMIGVEHQVRLIEDLLDVTRAMSGRLGLVNVPVALTPILVEAVEALRAVALEKRLDVVTRYALGEAQIHGDRDRVRQVFVNLLTNAVKFTPEGGTVWVTAEREGPLARIEVRDDGAGIPPDFLPFVFDPFRQANTGYRRGQDGLGLGLALAHRLVELHGGDVSCESDGLGRGATFRVFLPLRRDLGPRGPRGPATAHASASAELPTLHGIRILVIDDQVEARDSLAALLQQAGAIVATAGSGHDALAHLALSDASHPEIVVCDIAMPGEDGYATLRRIRAWESSGRRAGGAHRPAIAISAFAHREDRARTLAEGFHAHLTKPVVPSELVGTIAGLARARH